MALVSGSRLGVYEILGPLGAGGMGEVYRASDPRLGREVAIKVLPAAFASDPERLQRFEQEARAAAALNHPNILAVHDIGRCDGAPFIVSELLEGATLRERLQGGAVAVRKVIEYGVHIAKGLAAAHEKGIIHRDLKPENLFVTDDGRVKILDFGLAKLSQAEPALAGLSVLPAAAPDTLPGMVLGTIGYMAPEQVLVTAVLVAAVAIGAATYALLPGTQGVLDSRSYHASLLPPPNVSVGAGSRALALSPDGRTLAFVGRSADGIDRLWLRSLRLSRANR